MYIIRNVFRCKPGQAKNVIDKFKAAIPLMEGMNQRLMVDEVGGFWTVLLNWRRKISARSNRCFAIEVVARTFRTQ
jgi:hypothetical protein